AMKRLIKPFKLLVPLVLMLQANLFAQENDNDNRNENKKKYEFVKKKSVNRSYNVSASDKLNIQNSFGSVDVRTWDRNEIKVDVDVEVSANTEALAQKMLDRISVTDSKSGKDISFKTDMKDVNNSKGEKSTMQINYTISMPAGNPLNIKNDFGSTTVPDFRGEVDLTSKFGSLTTGTLSNIKNINVEFGKANLANITSAPVTIKFSKAVISKLSGSVKLNLEFCSSVRLNLDNNLSSLDLKTSYSTVNLKPIGDLPASYNISTSFGSFKNTSGVKFSSDEDGDKERGPKFDYEYSGKSGSGSIPVKVKSSFGKIIVGEASEEDMKDKGKNKTKDKSRT
ncbi:MAG: hypothetical protein KTQ13_01095, partial [Ferruginibacter sp.]|nr:hypothetical protein [Ferruginibacter sp.]